ncbi:MAG TPA: nuclear transport factor 2 family protein [Clostridia bacterium]|nr:nuclear transport factor 2 family protein [Clostridia bacterium]
MDWLSETAQQSVELCRSEAILMFMSHNETLHLAQELLHGMGSGAEAAEIAKLFSENMEWKIAGDTAALPWIGQRSGRAAIMDFITDSRALIERIRFEVHNIIADADQAVILGSLASKLKRTGKSVETDFAIILTVAKGEIVRFQVFEDSFAVSQAARG